MTDYPPVLPLDAASVLVTAATSGIADAGQHGDLACCIQAGWSLLGYGLGQWKPHTHNVMATATGGKKAKAPPKGEKAQLKALAKHLQPVAQAGPPDGQPQQATATAGAPDLSGVPWDQIVILLVTLIQAWLKKK